MSVDDYSVVPTLWEEPAVPLLDTTATSMRGQWNVDELMFDDYWLMDTYPLVGADDACVLADGRLGPTANYSD